MAWLTRTNWTPSQGIHSDDLNNIGNDIRNWGGDVNGGGFNLYNCTISGLLVDPTTSVGDLLVRGPAVIERLPINATDGLQLVTDHTQRLGVKWGVPGVGAMVDPTTTPGDLIVRPATGPVTRLGVGANGQFLMADPAQSTRMRWGTIGGMKPAGSDSWIGYNYGGSWGASQGLRFDYAANRLYVSQNASATLPADPLTGAVIRIAGADGAGPRITVDGFGAGGGNLTLRGAGGTGAAPTAVTSGMPLGSVTGHGYGATGYCTIARAAMSFFADQNWTDSAQGTYINWSTTPDNSVTTTERMRLTAAGNLLVGATADDASGSLLQVNGKVSAAFRYRSDQFFSPRAYASAVVSLNNPDAGYGGLAYQGASTYWYWNGASWGSVDFSTAGASRVTSLSPGSLTGAVTIGAGTNVSVTQSGQTITVAVPSIGVTTLLPGSLSGNVTLAPGTGTSVSSAGQVITIANTGLLSISPGSLVGNVTIGAGSNITVSQTGQTITVAAPNVVNTISGGTPIGGAVLLAAGANTSITQAGQTITIAVPNIGVSSISPGSLTGAVGFTANPGISITQSAQNLQIGNTGVLSLSPGSLSGAITLAAGANTSITQSGQTITIGVPNAVSTISPGLLSGAVTFQAGTFITLSQTGQTITINCSAISSGGITDPTTTKGDIIVHASTGTTRLGVGTDGMLLTADSTQTAGIKWSTASAAQTPWTSNIDGGNFQLANVSKIGIGTVSPATALQVIGGAVIGSATGSVARTFNLVGSAFVGLALQATSTGTTWYIDNRGNNDPPNNRLDFSIGSSDLVTFLPSGLVGIGVSSPSSILDVAQASAAGGRTNVTFTNTAATTAGNSMRLRMGAATGFSGTDVYPYIESIIEGGNNYSSLAFGVYNGSATERMRILSSGLIGIMTTAPAYRLDIAGMLNWRSQIHFSYTNADNGGYLSHFESGGFVALSYAASLGDSANWIAKGDGASILRVGFGMSLCVDRSLGYGTSYTPTQLWVVDSNGVCSMRQANIYNPGGNQAVLGMSTYSGAGACYGAITNTYNARGTSAAPGQSYAGDFLWTVNAYGADPTPNWIFGAGINIQVPTNFATNAGYGQILFNTNNGSSTGAERMRISAPGYVGIWTTNPTDPLTVNGAIRVLNFQNVNVANSGVFDYANSCARILGNGPNATTYGGFQFIAIKGDGTGAYIPFSVDAAGVVRAGQSNVSPVIDLGQQGQGPVKIAVYSNSGLSYGMGIGPGQLTFGASINPTSGTPQMVLTANGLLGVGTTSPSAMVHIVTANDTGSPPNWDNRYVVIGQAGSQTGGVAISYNSTSNYGVVQALSPNIAFRNLILNPGGGAYTAVGTVTPLSKFHVSGGQSGSTGGITVGDGQWNVAGSGGGITFRVDVGAADTVGGAKIQGLIEYGSEANGQQMSMGFYTNLRTGTNTYSGLAERMRITSAGNVLVGRTTDDGTGAKLQVVGTLNSSNGARISGLSTGGNIPASLAMDFYSGNARFLSLGPDVNTNGGFQWWTLRSDGSNGQVGMQLNPSGLLQLGSGFGTQKPRFQIVGGGPDTDQIAQILSFNGGTFSGWEVMCIDQSQKVGMYFANWANVAVLQSNATGQLQVIATVGGLNLITGTGGSSRLYINQAGAVGIATTSPQYPLDVNGDIRLMGADRSLRFTDGTPTNKFHISYATATGGLNFSETSVADGRIFIKPGGNVGISTTSPPVKLSLGDGAGTPPTATQFWIPGNGTTSDTVFATRICLGLDSNMDYGGFVAIEKFTNATVGLLLGTRWNAVDNPLLCARSAVGGGGVGIGNVNPGYKLDVSGDINTTGVLRYNGTPLSAATFGSVPSTRQVLTSAPLSGGGDLSADRTLNVNIAAVQTPWVGNIAAAGFNLNNVANLGVGAVAANNQLVVIPPTNLSSTQPYGNPQLQLAIGEASNNASYRTMLGFVLDTVASQWKGVVQANPAGTPLCLNPAGGSKVLVNRWVDDGSGATLQVAGNISINGTLVTPPGWTAYTPAVLDSTSTPIPGASSQSSYCIFGSLLFIQFNVSYTGNANAQEVYISLPVNVTGNCSVSAYQHLSGGYNNVVDMLVGVNNLHFYMQAGTNGQGVGLKIGGVLRVT